MSEPTDVETLMRTGRDHAFAGRYAEAEAVLRAALDRVRGDGTAVESRACGNLGSVFAARGRRFEAILLYRRGLAIDRVRGGEPLLEARHLANLAAMYVEIERWRPLERLLEELERVARRLPAADRDGARDLALWPRIQLALARGDLLRARRLADRFLDAFGDRVDPAAGAVREEIRADLLLAQGAPVRALAVLERALRIEGLPALDRLHLVRRVVTCLRDAGRTGEAVSRARAALDDLEGVVARDGAGEISVEVATALGRFLGSFVDHRDAARRACDVAAQAVLTRLAALHWCARTVPELCDLSEEDRVWIRDLRADYLRDQRELMRHVAGLLSDPASPRVSYLFSREDEEEKIRLCAWCGRVRTEGDRWLPVGRYVPAAEDLIVTHGMCPDCRDRHAPR